MHAKTVMALEFAPWIRLVSEGKSSREDHCSERKLKGGQSTRMPAEVDQAFSSRHNHRMADSISMAHKELYSSASRNSKLPARSRATPVRAHRGEGEEKGKRKEGGSR